VLEFYDSWTTLARRDRRQCGRAFFLDEVNYTGFSYRSDKTSRADLLESTPAR
jgi:hypothetical protein